MSKAMLSRNWPSLAIRRDYRSMLNCIAASKAAVDAKQFLSLFSLSHNTQHGAIQEGVNTKEAKFAFKHRMLTNNLI